jgi:hypothetical protein
MLPRKGVGLSFFYPSILCIPKDINPVCLSLLFWKERNNGKPHESNALQVDSFLFRKHLCIAFEKLDVNLFELLKRNAFKGLSLTTVQVVGRVNGFGAHSAMDIARRTTCVIAGAHAAQERSS